MSVSSLLFTRYFGDHFGDLQQVSHAVGGLLASGGSVVMLKISSVLHETVEAINNTVHMGCSFIWASFPSCHAPERYGNDRGSMKKLTGVTKNLGISSDVTR